MQTGPKYFCVFLVSAVIPIFATWAVIRPTCIDLLCEGIDRIFLVLMNG